MDSERTDHRSFGEYVLRLSIAHVTLGDISEEYRKPGVIRTSGFFVVIVGPVAEMRAPTEGWSAAA
jgi:hypothetical protein